MMVTGPSQNGMDEKTVTLAINTTTLRTNLVVFWTVVTSVRGASKGRNLGKTSAKSARFLTPNICIDFVLMASFKQGFI